MKKTGLLFSFFIIANIILARQVEQYTIFELELKGSYGGQKEENSMVRVRKG